MIYFQVQSMERAEESTLVIGVVQEMIENQKTLFTVGVLFMYMYLWWCNFRDIANSNCRCRWDKNKFINYEIWNLHL